MREDGQIATGKLLDDARTSTGLADFGSTHFMEALEVLVDSMNREACLSPAGRAMQVARIGNALENRLRRRALMLAHPEIGDQKLEVAAIIAGMPRTGSTMLQRLLAAAPQATATVWWETIYPLPRDSDGEGDIARRKADAVALMQQMVAASAGFESIHPMDAFAHDEELPLIEQSFISNIPEAMMYLPSYGEWLLGADQRWAYAELIEWLKILQWQDPSRRGRKWILKAPHHLTAVGTVLDAFPDAAIVMTHRRIDHVIASFASMVGSLTGGNTDQDFRHAQAHHWARRLRRNLQSMMAARATAEHRFVDVHYKALLSSPLSHAEKVFEVAGLEPTTADRAGWQGWLNGNRRDNRPSHRYELADFGLDANELRREFAFYIDAFGLEG